ncbi:MAG TPA: LLM class flavin-dependent oxidoreductase [Bacillus sp. (in: firmicutes)]|nr:LLM class flavin-dependent oxidoreductase [Bacillus sp. (in: firmicutes)]
MKQIHLNAFEMNCVNHLSHGLWAHPTDKRTQYKDPEYWVEIAQLLEKGKFDAVFLADVIGLYDIYKNSKDPVIETGMQVPANDPAVVIPLMAAVTKYLGFALTSTTTYDHPYPFARRMSTLDHITKGRIAWNVVTSALQNSAQNHGYDDLMDHDKRYEIADEFLEVCYKLWEGSWEDEAVIADKEKQIYADPQKVHYINHEGENFKVLGPHLSEPSIQRTPVIYQAGSSKRGKEFAAKHAECVFLMSPDPQIIKKNIEDLRTQAAANGRQKNQIKAFASLTVIVAPTNEEAERKLAEYTSYFLPEASFQHFSGSSGYDLSKYEEDEILHYTPTNHNQTAAQQFTKNSHKQQTIKEVKEKLSKIGNRGLLAVGTPEKVVDQMEAWIKETDLDGFNVFQVVSPDTLKDFVELVVPELQKRGLFRTEYKESTIRERLFGEGNNRLPKEHLASRYRKMSVY